MNDVKTIRVMFEKRGRAKYISHLDLMRTMTRVLRRAQIPLWYTEGFSKHPYITFAAPLSLGYEGYAETMDFRLEGEMSTEEIAERLNANMPVGLHVIKAAPAEMKAGQIANAVWCLTFDAKFERMLREVLEQAEILVQKRTKKKTLKTVDIKPFIRNTVWSAEEDGRVTLTLELPCGENNINPSLLVDAVCEELTDTVQIARLGVYDAEGKLFQ